MKKALLMIFGLALLAQGCASFIQPRLPKEFEGGKLKEDPPGTYAPELAPSTRQA